MDVVQGQVNANHKTAARMIRQAAEEGAQVIVLPEMWTSGYDFARLEEHTEDLKGVSCQLLSSLAKELGVWIVGGSMPLRYEDGVCNTAVTFDADGNLVHVYRKVHLIGLMEEDKYLLPGEEVACFSLRDVAQPTERVVAASLICYDLRFPEIARGAAQLGAKIIFIPAEWPVQRRQHWDVLLTARAIENQVFVVGANMSGKNENDRFSGGSKVIDPWGNIIAEAGENPTILYADVELSQVDTIRERVPSLRDRRPTVYAKFQQSP